MMRKLILIKHAQPQVLENVPSHEWGLSPDGRQACIPLAEKLRVHEPAVVVTSDEPKAFQTGELVGRALKVPVTAVAGLQEHDRSNVPLMPPRDFISMMALFFKDPDRLVLGRETADQAAQRFERAVEDVLEKHPNGNVAVVSHGTVLALFASRHGGGDGFVLWRRMKLPSFIVYQLPEYHVTEQVDG